MTKKRKTEEFKKTEDFNLTEALKECPKPEWYKKAFCKTMDISKIKNTEDLIKAMKKYGGMN